MKIFIATIIILGFMFAYACTRKPPPPEAQQIANYTDHLQKTAPTASVNDVKAAFNSLFGNLKNNATEENVRQLYSEDLYFNDTFRIITNLDELVGYMVHTGEIVDSTTVNILDVVKGQHDYYVRWEMDMRFSTTGRDIHSHSIGMTQLRFNKDGKIVFHQDFWDGAEGFYQHLPLIGYAVRKVRSQL
ncbi:nuclear transport factor 2 family protein [Marinicella sp. W31]|uniref:nuclear transport factor 2 family protein n=1 Tax=Marinicella sp. W31 TaxID=3023713 RepID=UPI0037579EAC